MQNLQKIVKGSGNKGSVESGTSKDENSDMNNGISGEGLVVCWNKFLPFRSLKVLVVESDASTRHVVSALLKKCGYEVTAVANGLQAWKVLEDQNNHVDIVLTEVVLPFLTGLGLLRKIMSHETRKNLPVIMMSLSDSLGVVLKCLSNGATDFLVKPIRKNELRTLWQHVWRKCHNSSGCTVAESDAITRSKALVKSSGNGKSGSCSNNRDDNGTHGLNNRSHGLSDRNGSDQGSGTQVHGLSDRNGSDQGSGTQQAPRDNRKAKPDLRPESSAGHLADPPMHNWDLNLSAGELEGHNIGDKTMDRDLATRVPGNLISKLKPSREKARETKVSSRDKTVQEYTSKDNGHSGKGLFKINEKGLGKEIANGDALLAAASTKNLHPCEKIADAGERTISSQRSNVQNPSDVCFFELGSMQSEAGKGSGGKAARQRNVLGHSSHSAFSRYGSASKGPKVQSGNEGSCSPLEEGSEGASEEPFAKHQGNSSGTTTDHNSEDNRKSYDKGLSDTVLEPHGCKFKQPNTKSPHPNSVQPVKRTHTPGEPISKANGSSADTYLDQPEPNQHIQFQHHYHPYHHHQYHVQNMHHPLKVSNHGDTTMNDVPVMDRQLQPPFTDGVMSNLNRTHLCHNVGCSASVNVFGINPMADAGIVYGFMNGIAANRELRRSAAIHKFRQKRKDRCFAKKIRCEGRKILADQRPRMKGQFVRRTDISNNTGVHFC